MAAFGGIFASAVFATATCGGTSGMEGLTLPPPPTEADATVGRSAPLGLDAGLFDVEIFYADRLIPEVSPPVSLADGGADTAYPWPTCPAFIPVGPDGGAVSLGSEINQVPAAYGDGGSVVFAADATSCAAYGWIGTTAIDNCLTSSTSGWGQGDFSLLPPCNWCEDAGSATQGSGAGRLVHALCLELYACAMASGCGAETSPSSCLCGSASGSSCIAAAGGPCATEELAALQYPATSVQEALTNYTQIDPAFLGYGGSALNYVFQNARTNGCFPPDARGGASP